MTPTQNAEASHLLTPATIVEILPGKIQSVWLDGKILSEALWSSKSVGVSEYQNTIYAVQLFLISFEESEYTVYSLLQLDLFD